MYYNASRRNLINHSHVNHSVVGVGKRPYMVIQEQEVIPIDHVNVFIDIRLQNV